MTEQEKWDIGVASVEREYEALSPALKSEVGRCAAAIKSCKTRINLIAEEAGSLEICALCNGECCKSGNNHFRGVDLIVYLSDGRELFTPCFEGNICSFLGECGCLMEPQYRPYNCITFICERVEERLDLREKERFYALALDLRALYGELEQLLGKRFNTSLLSACERQLQGADKRRPGKSPGCGEVL